MEQFQENFHYTAHREANIIYMNIMKYFKQVCPL